MRDNLKIKTLLYQECLVFVTNRLKTITNIIASNKKALNSETKSSAGDKHETGRAMLQLEMEKAGQQLAAINQMKAVLQRIDPIKESATAILGSLVVTDKATYFLAISAGKIIIDTKEYYAISIDTPIGQQILGKQVGRHIPFNKAKILQVV